jgi:hypothetical protein
MKPILPLLIFSLALVGCGSSDKLEAPPKDADGLKALNNSAPQISGSPNINADLNVYYSFTPQSRDLDGDLLTFSVENLPGWANFNVLTGEVNGTPSVEVLHKGIIISVTDETDTVSLSAFDINVLFPAPVGAENTAPQITGSPSSEVNVMSHYSFTPQTQDLDKDPLTFTVANLPSWANFNKSTGEVSGIPSLENLHKGIVIFVSDGAHTVALNAFDINVVSPIPSGSGNTAPKISGSPNIEINMGTHYSFIPQANDLDEDPLTFTVVNLPSWAKFNASNGEVYGVPTQEYLHEDIVISVSDGFHAVSLSGFNINVIPVKDDNVAPKISGSPSINIFTDTYYSFTPHSEDSDRDILTFSVTNLPSWASFDEDTGQIDGIPTLDGVYAGIVISVSDRTDTAYLNSFSINVMRVNTAPEISGSPNIDLEANTGYLFLPESEDFDGDVLTFSVENLPDWASFDVLTGGITGTPILASVYENIVITVSDGTDTTSLSAFDITVKLTPISVTIKWEAPSENLNGEDLGLLQAYKIFYGTSQGSYEKSITVNDGDIIEYTVSNLVPSDYYFSMAVITENGMESAMSEEFEFKLD